MTAARDVTYPRVPPRVATHIVALTVVVALGIVSAANAAGRSTTAVTSPGAPPAYALYLTGTPGEAVAPPLLALDPITLLDSADQSATMFARSSSQAQSDAGALWTWWSASADGSTVLAVEQRQTNGEWTAPADVTYTIVDGPSGALRARFHPPAWVQVLPMLSGDGSRLLITGVAKPPRDQTPACWGGSCLKPVWPFERRGPAPKPDPRERLRWYVVDTGDGRLVTAPPVAGDPVAGPWLDPAGRRLYLLSSSPASPGSRGKAATIEGYDLETGAALGRVVLPEIVLGPRVEGDQVFNDLPGVALSPDGRVLAVVHPDLSAIAIIDAARMTVDRVVEMGRVRGALDRVLGWLGLAPAPAAAKELPGTTVSAVFAPDGRRLYLFGYTAPSWDEGRSLGLRAVDLTTGEIEAEADSLADDAPPFAVLPAPDGRTVYVQRATYAGAYAILRLDAATLDLEARRIVSDYRQLLLIAK